jgi:AbrB family looped-hinge helix DNA binding protein
MAEGTIIINGKNRAIINLPAYLRDKYGLTKGLKVDITDDGKSIIITPKKE